MNEDRTDGADNDGDGLVDADFVTTVLDFGVDNTLLGTLASSNQPQGLEAVREALPETKRMP